MLKIKLIKKYTSFFKYILYNIYRFSNLISATPILCVKTKLKMGRKSLKNKLGAKYAGNVSTLPRYEFGKNQGNPALNGLYQSQANQNYSLYQNNRMAISQQTMFHGKDEEKYKNMDMFLPDGRILHGTDHKTVVCNTDYLQAEVERLELIWKNAETLSLQLMRMEDTEMISSVYDFNTINMASIGMAAVQDLDNKQLGDMIKIIKSKPYGSSARNVLLHTFVEILTKIPLLFTKALTIKPERNTDLEQSKTLIVGN